VVGEEMGSSYSASPLRSRTDLLSGCQGASAGWRKGLKQSPPIPGRGLRNSGPQTGKGGFLQGLGPHAASPLWRVGTQALCVHLLWRAINVLLDCRRSVEQACPGGPGAECAQSRSGSLWRCRPAYLRAASLQQNL
jgi:hypothetical protein